jgi:hypothetical protein
MATTQNWQRTSDGYRRGPVEIHDNGAGLGPATGSGRWAVELDGEWIANVDTLDAAKDLATELEHSISRAEAEIAAADATGLRNLTSTAGQLEIARDRMRGEWDADGVISVHLPKDVAQRLLAERGWIFNPGPNGYAGSWSTPGSDPGTGAHTYETDEALTLALVAENS